MLDADLADLCQVETRALVQAVRRNLGRFPVDFVFQLTRQQLERWGSPIVMYNPEAKMGLRRSPYAFTEQGVAMLSSVLRSDRAVRVNIAIMRAFVQPRQALASHRDVARRLHDMEKKYDRRFKVVFDAIRQPMLPVEPERRPIGFHTEREADRGHGKASGRRRRP